MGGFSDTSFASQNGADFIEFVCSDAACGGNDGLINFTFSSPFNSAIRNSAGPATTNFTVAQLVNIDTGSNFYSASGANVSGQADFVPVAPALFGFMPLASFLFRFRRGFAKLRLF
jgi:hypothetical protein